MKKSKLKKKIRKLNKRADLISRNCVLAEVESIGFTVEPFYDHGYLKVKIPYGYKYIKHLNKGDEIKILTSV